MQFSGSFQTSFTRFSNSWSVIDQNYHSFTKVLYNFNFYSSLRYFLKMSFFFNQVCTLFQLISSQTTEGIEIALLSSIFSLSFQPNQRSPLIANWFSLQPDRQQTIETNYLLKYRSPLAAILTLLYIYSQVALLILNPFLISYIQNLFWSNKLLSTFSTTKRIIPFNSFFLAQNSIVSANLRTVEQSAQCQLFSQSVNFFAYWYFYICDCIPTDIRLYYVSLGQSFKLKQQSHLLKTIPSFFLLPCIFLKIEKNRLTISSRSTIIENTFSKKSQSLDRLKKSFCQIICNSPKASQVYRVDQKGQQASLKLVISFQLTYLRTPRV